MATEGGEPALAVKIPEKPERKDQKQDQPTKGDAPAGEKKLSNAELKKKAKEEKAARRAQVKAVQPAQGPAGGQQGAGSEVKGGKGKPKQDGQQGGSRPPLRPSLTGSVIKETKPSIPECFSHLSMARRIDMTHADKDVNPAVLVLGQHMSTFAISDSITRLEATLLAFKKVRVPHPAL